MNVLAAFPSSVFSSIQNYLPDSGKLVESVKKFFSSKFVGVKNTNDGLTRMHSTESSKAAPAERKESFCEHLIQAGGTGDSAYTSSPQISKSVSSPFAGSKLSRKSTKLGAKSTLSAPKPPEVAPKLPAFMRFVPDRHDGSDTYGRPKCLVARNSAFY